MVLPFLSKSDAALVRKVLAEDSAAFENLVARYQRKAYGLARAAGVPPGSLEDVVQESFLAAFRGLARLENPEAFGAWFLSIVRHLARKRLRRRARVELGVDLDLREAPPAEPLETRELHDELWRQVGELPAKTREAIFLYYYDGCSTREVATALGLSVSAVKNRLERGRKSLREGLWRRFRDALREEVPSKAAWNSKCRRTTLLCVIAAATARDSTVAGGANGAPAGRRLHDARSASGLSRASILGGVILSSKRVAVLVGVAIVLSAGILMLPRSGRNPVEREPTSGLSGKDAELPRRVATAANELSAPSPADPAPDGASETSTAAPAAETPALRVRVVDVAGERVPSARVSVEWSEWRTNEQGEMFRLLAEGSRELEQRGDGDFADAERHGDAAHLRASAPGFPQLGPMEIEVPQGGISKPVVVVMERGDPLRVRLEDVFGDHAPVPGAVAGAEDSTDRPILQVRTRPKEFLHRTRSDEDGRFTLQGLRSGIRYWSWVWIEAEGYGRTVVEVREFAAETEYRIPLYPPTHIRVHVEDEDGEPVDGFEYGFADFSHWNFKWKGLKVEGGATRHELDHFFRLEPRGLASTESTTLGVRVGGQVVTRQVKIPYGSETEVTVRVGGTGTVVAGHAFDPDGFPVAGALVALARERQPLAIKSLERQHHSSRGRDHDHGPMVRTGMDGSFSIPAHPGMVALGAYHPDQTAYASEVFEVRSGEVTRHEFRFPRGASISGGSSRASRSGPGRRFSSDGIGTRRRWARPCRCIR